MQIIMQANLSKEDILQAIADYVSKEKGRDVTTGDINLSQDDLSADVTIGVPDDKTEKPKIKAKRAPKKDAWTDNVSIKTEESEETEVEETEIGIVDEALDTGPDEKPEEVQEEIQEEQADEPAPVPKKTGSIFNFASEAS